MFFLLFSSIQNGRFVLRVAIGALRTRAGVGLSSGFRAVVRPAVVCGRSRLVVVDVVPFCCLILDQRQILT